MCTIISIFDVTSPPSRDGFPELVTSFGSVINNFALLKTWGVFREGVFLISILCSLVKAHDRAMTFDPLISTLLQIGKC